MNTDPTPYSTIGTPSSESMFDVLAANNERLNWRLGGEKPTERALGINEALSRVVASEIKIAKQAKDVDPLDQQGGKDV